MKASERSQNTGLKQLFLFACSILIVLSLTSFHTNTNTRTSENRNDDKFTVVLDAGHGGYDPGNLGNGYKEKNIALNIVLKTGELLEKIPNIEVIYTRKDDTFVDLYRRGEIANKAGADLFVSVHCDSHTSTAHGAGTFVLGLHANKQNFEIAKKENSVIYLEDDYRSRYADYDINSPESVIGLTIMQEEFLDQSIALAKAIQDNFANKLNRVDRKVKQAGFIVLHQTFMPSVLVETGFLTNNDEGAYLNSQKGQSQMGTAIAEAVLTYKDNVMANIADFSPGTVSEVPEPGDLSESNSENQDINRESSDKPVTEVANEKKSNRNASKEAAEIIAEASKNSNRNTPDNAQVTEPGEVVISAKPAVAIANKRVAPEEGKEIEKNSTDENTNLENAEIQYKVQLMASAKDITLNPNSFNGLNKVAKEPIKNLYRYMYGSTNSLEEAKLLKSNADIKGYPTSFIVVYRNGERLSFRESNTYISGE
ncbi:hypothetical protein LCGC14_0749690 [marine sediment metagenome]|uniref:N-acetylmuramoyl-L-alanine amidase n=2 Tax=root TaxID=1 RepID=A0A831VWN9_9FLAO|nr:N-acetylmuramoyl-L-alanine amidase [Pricia antarctica]